MRTVDATLTAALLSGNYTPYAYIICYVDEGDEGSIYETHDALFFELTGVEAKVIYKKQTYESAVSFKIERGVRIGSTEYGLTSSAFYPYYVQNNSGTITMYGHLFQREFITLSDAGTYRTVITAFCTALEKTAVFKNTTDEYWDYQFLLVTNGEVMNLSNTASFLAFIRQKYLLFAVDNGDEEMLFYYPGLTLSSSAVDWTLEPVEVKYESIYEKRNFIWKDEADVSYHAFTTGIFSTYPVHNLGFISSSDRPPSVSYPSGTYVHINLQNFEFTCRPDLRYQDGDSLYIASCQVLSQILVREVWQSSEWHGYNKKFPPWQMVITGVQFFGNTEGGSIPVSMVNSSPYIPINTSTFDGVLSAVDNNIQAALETIDDHGHTFTGGSTDHHDLTGLGDDDHTQYHTNARGDARYRPIAYNPLEVSAADPTGHTEGIDFHFDSTAGNLYVWDGSIWVMISGGGTPAIEAYLLLENGTDFIIHEHGDQIILG